MARIFLNFIWLMASAGIFILLVLILKDDVPMPDWVPFDYHAGPWLALFLKFFGVVLMVTPFYALLFSVFALGGQRARGSLFSIPHQNSWSLRLSPGMRWAMIVLGALLFSAIIFALWATNEPLGIWLFVSPLLLFCVYCVIVFATIRVDFDQTHIVAMNWTLRWHKFRWDTLEKITYNKEWSEYRLYFGDFGMARVSTYFDELHDFSQFVTAKLKEAEDARIARG